MRFLAVSSMSGVSRPPATGQQPSCLKSDTLWRCGRSGVSELRVKDEDGIFRVFYFTATAKGVLVFHAFAKKTQRTPPLEIELAKKRLKELLDA